MMHRLLSAIMYIQFASDLHLDLLQDRFPGYRAIAPAPQADVLVLAGDIHHGAGAVETFADWPVPVIYVHGNHEAYGTSCGELVHALRRTSAGTGMRYLERSETLLDGVRFLGCCLWTDYQLYPEARQEAIRQIEDNLLDHRRIRSDRGLFTADDALELHQAARAWLEERLADAYPGPTVVVSHHGPHPGSVHPRYTGSLINAAFVSDLSPMLGKADLWIHGHVHDSFDYLAEGTRIVANPRGYALNRRQAATPADIEWENPLFDPARVVRVGPGGR